VSDPIADTPWSVEMSGTDPPYWIILDARGNVIAVEGHHDGSSGPHMGHAHLLAASAGMLDALRRIAALTFHDPDGCADRVSAIAADALARAEGLAL
jgi:hypothetical protein